MIDLILPPSHTFYHNPKADDLEVVRLTLAGAIGDLLTQFAGDPEAVALPSAGDGDKVSVAVPRNLNILATYKSVAGSVQEIHKLSKLARIIELLTWWHKSTVEGEPTDPRGYIADAAGSRMVPPLTKPLGSNLQVAIYAACWYCGGRSELPPDIPAANQRDAAAALGLAVESELQGGPPFEHTMKDLLA